MIEPIKFIVEFDQIRNYRGRIIFVALNLMYLGNVKLLHHNMHVAWIDGLIGKLLLNWSTKRNFSKVAGSRFLRYIISAKIFRRVSVLGDCPTQFENLLHDNGIELGLCLKLRKFDINKMKAVDFKNLEEDIIISLPSPKQELLANFLMTKHNKIKRIFCVGGAVHMLADPSLECPEVLRRLNLEWAFRLRTDPMRRIYRLLKQFILFIIYIRELAKLNFKEIKTEK